MVQEINVLFEVGSTTTLRIKPVNGVTHDWTLFVRGYRGADISIIVEKVVFHLHESFPKPIRVIKHPPYEVNESGYGSFEATIEVHFRNKSEPRKAEIKYDLWLATNSHDPATTQRSERMKFYDVTEEFASKLFKSGGFIPNTSSDPFSTKALNIDSKPPHYATSSKPDAANSHSKKSSSSVLVASKPSSTAAAAASKADAYSVSAGRSSKPTSLALTSTTLNTSGKPAGDGLQPSVKCVTPQTPDSFADLFSQPHLTIKNKEKKNPKTVTSSTHSNSSSGFTPKEASVEVSDKDLSKQKRLLESSLFGDDDSSPPVKKVKHDKEKHNKDIKSKELKAEMSERGKDSKAEKREKDRESKHSKSDKNREVKEEKHDRHERSTHEEKSAKKSEHVKHKKRDDEVKVKHPSSHIDSNSQSSSETGKHVDTKHHSRSADSKHHHRKSHKEHHHKSSSKPSDSTERHSKKDEVRAFAVSAVEKATVEKAFQKTSIMNTNDSDLSGTSDNEETISECLTKLAKSSTQRLNIDSLFGSDDSNDSTSCPPIVAPQITKCAVPDSSPLKQLISSKNSMDTSNPRNSEDKSSTKSNSSHERSSSSAKKVSKSKPSKRSSDEFKSEPVKSERKCEATAHSSMLHSASSRSSASPSPFKVKLETVTQSDALLGRSSSSTSPFKVKSEMLNGSSTAFTVASVLKPKEEVASVMTSDLGIGFSDDDSDCDNSGESSVVDVVSSALQDHSSGVSNDGETSSLDLASTRAPNGEFLSVLLDLQMKLMTSLNDDQLEKLTTLIEETGQYKISDDTFDFDLCLLDTHTVQKIRQFVQQSA